MKVALITGITGMDGSHLTEFLLTKDYIIHGIVRRSSSINTSRIDHLYEKYINDRLFLHYGDLSDTSCLERIINTIQPDEIYNLAAMSHVKVSFEIPEYCSDITALGAVRILEIIRNSTKPIKFYQASSSEMYGGKSLGFLTESSPFNPRSPYAISKLYAHMMTINYREAYNMYACCGILFNHTSPRRGDTFVEKKVVNGAYEIYKKKRAVLKLGNLYSYRDIGHSKDYCRAIWMMLQQQTPSEYVICTGNYYQIKDIVNRIFKLFGMDLEWEGEGMDEVGKVDGIVRIVIDEKYFRPTEVDVLVGNCTKAQNELGWFPEYNLNDILKEMVDDVIKLN